MSTMGSTLMYVSMYGDEGFYGGYGLRVMSVSLKKFERYSVHICNDIKDLLARSNHTRIAPAVFNPVFTKCVLLMLHWA